MEEVAAGMVVVVVMDNVIEVMAAVIEVMVAVIEVTVVVMTEVTVAAMTEVMVVIGDMVVTGATVLEGVAVIGRSEKVIGSALLAVPTTLLGAPSASNVRLPRAAEAGDMRDLLTVEAGDLMSETGIGSAHAAVITLPNVQSVSNVMNLRCEDLV